MINTIFALKGAKKLGKTPTIKFLYDLFIKRYPNAVEMEEHKIDGYDIRHVLIVNGVKIGIESQGDPKYRLFISIPLFVRIKCNIIICATRTRGSTVSLITEQSQSYDIKWYQPQKVHKPGEEDSAIPSDRDMANETVATTIFDDVLSAINS